MATDCGTTCTAACKNDCNDTCKDKCTNGCNTGCRKGCFNSCVDDCEITCKNYCDGSCSTSCTNGCYDSCKNKCKGYCSSICQTYCQKEQVFTKNRTENHSDIKNPIGKQPFSWKNEVDEGKTIQITADEWNTLKGYIKSAVPYCGGTAPSKADASDDPTNVNNLISAEKYNDLAKGLGFKEEDLVTAEKTLISASLIDKLRTTYNSRQIISNYPKGQYTGGKNECCQKGQICMADGQLLSHQKTYSCGDQTTSSCGDQTKKP